MGKGKIVALLLSLLVINICPAKDKPIRTVIDEALKFSVIQTGKLYESIQESPDKLPRSIDNENKLVTSTDKYWTSGFFPGTMWYLYEYSRLETIHHAAKDLTHRIEKQQYTTDNHDVGFMINCSFGNGYRLTSDQTYKQVIIQAAKSLSTRFKPVVGCIRSWDSKKWEYAVIIDNMMNLELLCEATKITGDSSYLKIAVSHADTTMKYHFRPDGSSYHLVSYDTIRGGFKERVTHQGAYNESAWSRGQAWGLYGFTSMYRETKNLKYLKQAIKIADFISNNPTLPEDKIPYWDFNAPGIPHALRDASAAAIMASAFIELSTFVDKKLSIQYLNIAEKQIRSLASPAYRAQEGENGNFILKHSVGFMAKNSEIDVPLSYADYYFVEALMRYRNLLNNGKDNRK